MTNFLDPNEIFMYFNFIGEEIPINVCFYLRNGNCLQDVIPSPNDIIGKKQCQKKKLKMNRI